MNSTLGAILFGKRIANKLIKSYPGVQLLFTFESIGDQCMELAYSQQYKSSHGLSRLAIVTTNPNHPVFLYFKGQYDLLIQLSKKEFNYLLKFFKSDFGQIYRRNHSQIKCVFYTAYVRSDLLMNNPYVCLSSIEKMIYEIPPDSVPCQISRPDCTEWIETLKTRSDIVPGKTVLMNPYANSCSGVPVSFFSDFAQKLKENGFAVVTGVHGNQQPIEGTQGVDFSLDKAVAIVEYCGYVVGLRSGFLDLCAFSSAMTIAIDSDDYPLSYATKIEKWWPQNQRLKTYTYNFEISQFLMDEIIHYMRGD